MSFVLDPRDEIVDMLTESDRAELVDELASILDDNPDCVLGPRPRRWSARRARINMQSELDAWNQQERLRQEQTQMQRLLAAQRQEQARMDRFYERMAWFRARKNIDTVLDRGCEDMSIRPLFQRSNPVFLNRNLRRSANRPGRFWRRPSLQDYQTAVQVETEKLEKARKSQSTQRKIVPQLIRSGPSSQQ